MSLLRGGGGGALLRKIKIPQYEFVLKMQGGLMREGGHICGTLRYTKGGGKGRGHIIVS